VIFFSVHDSVLWSGQDEDAFNFSSYQITCRDRGATYDDHLKLIG